jgi:hypothetical protein
MKLVAGSLILLLTLCLPVWGDVTPDPGLPDDLKSQTDVTASVDQITQAINTEVQKLANDSDGASQGMARAWLGVQGVGSPAYSDAYCTALNKALATVLADPKASVRTRLNVAIVVAKVTDTSKNAELLPVTQTLLTDSSDGIILWAERAAGSQLTAILNDPNAVVANRQALLKAMEDAALKHCSTPTLGGFIIEQVYSDINPFLMGVTPQGTALNDLVEANLALQKGRIALYTSGIIPESPYVDTYASDFLLDPGTWVTLTPQQQLQAVQQAGDLICRAALLEMGGTAGTEQQSDLMRTASREGDYLSNLASKTLNNANLAAAATNVGTLSVASQPAQIKQFCQQIEDSLAQSFPGFVPVSDFAHPAAGATGQ